MRGEHHPKMWWLSNNFFSVRRKLTISFSAQTLTLSRSLYSLFFQAYTMKFFNNSMNKSIRHSFGLVALVLVVLCLSFATATVENGGVGGPGPQQQQQLRGGGDLGGAAAYDQPHHPAAGRALGGSCGTYNHPYAVYCKFACPYYKTTARCIVDHWICKGC
jgi:hypothetical protein